MAFWKFLFLFTLVLSPSVLMAQEEEDEVVDADDVVRPEDEPLDDGEPIKPVDDSIPPLEEEDYVIKASPSAKVFYAFPKHSDETTFPGGKVVKALIGFQNNGEKAFIVDNVEGSFRYPMDYNYVIQNFTSFRYAREVAPASLQTFLYMFVPSEQLAGGSRTFGLVLKLNYRDEEGNLYTDSAFNETVSVVEYDEGFDTEIFFMYVLLAAVSLLCVLGAQYVFTSMFGSRKQSRKVIETGTQGGIDYDYIPKEHLGSKKKVASK